MAVSVVRVNASSSYDIIIGSGILANAADYIPEKFLSGTIAVITDSNVEKLYAETLLKALYGKAKRLVIYAFPAGEESKNMETLTAVLEFLAANKITRSDLILALGGGVVGDMTGFAASVYLRGVAFGGIPTTFLSAVDSSVGGKTGVNLASGKNLAGVFSQPEFVITDTDAFKTLDDDTFADGTAETLKHGILADAALFDRVASTDRNGVMKDINEIVKRNVEIKASVVEQDEFDTGKRQLLNLGHTVGHAIEKCSCYKSTHGKAVAAGTAIIARAAEKLGFVEKTDTDRVLNALRSHSLPTETEFSTKQLCEAALLDKKRSNSSINLVMPKRVGECFLQSTPVEELENIIKLGRDGA